MKDKKEMIMKALKKGGELSTTRMAHEISANIYRAEDLLKELEKEKKVKSNLTKKGIIWRLIE